MVSGWVGGMCESPASGNKFGACSWVPGTTGHCARPCRGVTGRNRTVSDLGEGTQAQENPSVTLQWPRTQGIQKSPV